MLLLTVTFDEFLKFSFIILFLLIPSTCFSFPQIYSNLNFNKEDLSIEIPEKINNKHIFDEFMKDLPKQIQRIFGNEGISIIEKIEYVDLFFLDRNKTNGDYLINLKKSKDSKEMLGFCFFLKQKAMLLTGFYNQSNIPYLSSRTLETGILKDVSKEYLIRFIEKKNVKNFVFEKKTKIVDNYRFIYRKKINGFYSKYSKAKIFLKENGFFTRFDNLISSKYFPAKINYTFDQAKGIAVKKYYEIRKNKIASYRKRGHEIPSDSTNEVEVRPLEYIDVNKEYVGIYEHFLGKMLLDEVVNKKRPIYMRPNYNFVFEEEELPKSGILPKIEMPSDQNYESIFYYDESKSRFLDEERLVYPILLVSDDRENFINGYYRDFLVIIYIDAETGEMIGGR